MTPIPHADRSFGRWKTRTQLHQSAKLTLDIQCGEPRVTITKQAIGQFLTISLSLKSISRSVFTRSMKHVSHWLRGRASIPNYTKRHAHSATRLQFCRHSRWPTNLHTLHNHRLQWDTSVGHISVSYVLQVTPRREKMSLTFGNLVGLTSVNGWGWSENRIRRIIIKEAIMGRL
jgi:hypothetical protein